MNDLVVRKSGLSRQQSKTMGRVSLAFEFEFISTKMEQDFSVPIKSITRLVLKKTQTCKLEL